MPSQKSFYIQLCSWPGPLENGGNHLVREILDVSTLWQPFGQSLAL